MIKLKDIFYEEEKNYNDERIYNLTNKLYTNKYSVIYVLSCAIFLYNLIFLNKISVIVFLLIADFVYDDIMLAINKAYIYTKAKYIICFGYFLFGIKYLENLIWENSNIFLCLIITIIITSIYLYIIKKISFFNNI